MEADNQPPTTPPPARRGGAPRGNENRLQSGVSAWAKAGRIPRCYRALRRELREFATGLAAEVERVKGRPASMYELCVVSSVVRHSGRVALLERWLAREHATLSVSDRLALLKEVGSASSSRDKALQSLGLDRDAAAFDPASIYIDVPTPHASEAAPRALNGQSDSEVAAA